MEVDSYFDYIILCLLLMISPRDGQYTKWWDARNPWGDIPLNLMKIHTMIPWWSRYGYSRGLKYSNSPSVTIYDPHWCCVDPGICFVKSISRICRIHQDMINVILIWWIKVTSLDRMRSGWYHGIRLLKRKSVVWVCA